MQAQIPHPLSGEFTPVIWVSKLSMKLLIPAHSVTKNVTSVNKYTSRQFKSAITKIMSSLKLIH